MTEVAFAEPPVQPKTLYRMPTWTRPNGQSGGCVIHDIEAGKCIFCGEPEPLSIADGPPRAKSKRQMAQAAPEALSLAVARPSRKRAVLTETMLAAIQADGRLGVPVAETAARLGLHRSTVYGRRN
jgi:hypothetical protein